MKKVMAYIWKMLKNNWGLKIIALIFAFIIWSYVMASTDPVRDLTVRDVNVDYIGMSELTAKDLTADLGDLADKIDVTIEAKQSLLKSMNTSTVKATVDLQSINEPGEATVDIDVTTNSASAAIVKKSQSAVKINVDRLSSRKVPVECTTNGSVVDGYYMGDPQLSAETVKVTGAKTDVEKISKAVCKVPVDGLTQSVRATYELTLLDKDGNEVVLNSSDSSVPSVIVSIDIFKKKTVDIDISNYKSIITNPKEGYEVTGIEIDPTQVDIAGTDDALAKISSVTLNAINLNGADSSVIMTTEVTPVNDAEVVSGKTVSVYVKIAEKQAERTFANIKINADGLADGLKAKLSKKTTSLTLSGPASAVSALAARDINLYVDLSGKTAGTYDMSVLAGALTNIDAKNIKITDATVSVTIS